MASETPLVRYLIACREIIVSSDNRDVTLRGIVHAVVALPGESFPLRQDLALYALLTNGRGPVDVSIRFGHLRRGEDGTAGEEIEIATSPAQRVELGQDPSAVLGLPIPRIRLPFREPGQYVLYLLCDGQPIGQVYLEARPADDTK
jgi:hypothetical protein